MHLFQFLLFVDLQKKLRFCLLLFVHWLVGLFVDNRIGLIRKSLQHFLELF